MEPTYLFDALALAAGVAAILLVWNRGSIFAGWRNYAQALTALSGWQRWLGRLLTCRLCLACWLGTLLWLAGLLPGYLTAGAGLRLLAWLVLVPAAVLLGLLLEESAERILDLKDKVT